MNTATLTPAVVTGDATTPRGDGPRIVAHVCNDVGRWGRGFVLAVSARWPEPELEYRRMWQQRTGTHLPLGHVQLVRVADELWVANMIGQHGIHGTDGQPPIRYPALRDCLQALAEEALARGASVHMPRIGCGLAGGSWRRVGAIVRAELCERTVPVTVYDLAKQRATVGPTREMRNRQSAATQDAGSGG